VVRRLPRRMSGVAELFSRRSKCAARDRWIGGAFAVSMTAWNGSRTTAASLILPGWHHANPAPKAWPLCERRLQSDGRERFGHPPGVAGNLRRCPAWPNRDPKIWAATALNGYFDFRHAAQSCLIERETIDKKTGKKPWKLPMASTAATRDCFGATVRVGPSKIAAMTSCMGTMTKTSVASTSLAYVASRSVSSSLKAPAASPTE
jgi:hypothetical protein